jgi:phosphatidylserine/phosphatidylglycerophosphate/cardiolipin synthase-like enzyme
MYLDAIARAEHHIWLTHAYLIPDDDLITALIEAAARGVDVSVIIPAQSNHVLADWLSRDHYETLLASGIKLFLYQGAMIHSKTATIDHTWSTVGTANLDTLSLLGNYEVNVEVFSPDFAAAMEDVFQTDLSNCVPLDLADWRRRPWWVANLRIPMASLAADAIIGLGGCGIRRPRINTWDERPSLERGSTVLTTQAAGSVIRPQVGPRTGGSHYLA